MDYELFVSGKRAMAPTLGIPVEPENMNYSLFPFQLAITSWALRKGRAAIFADTGLGKTLMQLEWASHMADAGNVLILAPLAVAQQTVRIGAEFGYSAVYAREQAQARDGITVTNYEMLHKFDASQFQAVVLDESSILKSFEGKVRTTLIETFRNTPYRLCCTATPAPNDVAELANHAAFLGVMSREEMLSTFFVFEQLPYGRGTRWRLKGHAEEAFYKWLASWSMSVKKPSDLGFDDADFALPPLSIEATYTETEYVPDGQMFSIRLHGIQDRAAARKSTLEERCQAAAGMVMADESEPWLVWCGLNDEGRRLAELIPGAVLIEGADSPEKKAQAAADFVEGITRVLISKVAIFGFGLNFQHCARMVFVGLNDSYEQYYQAIRRCYRFGQQRPVVAHVVLSRSEEMIFQNVLDKEAAAVEVSTRLIDAVKRYEVDELTNQTGTVDLPTDTYEGQGWRLLQGDVVNRIKEIADSSVDLTVFSPPFSTLYTYSPSDRDLGNSRDRDQFLAHYHYVAEELLRVIKPGRITVLHVQQEIRQKVKEGVIGLHDLRGDFIRAMESVGFILHGEVVIDKDPQAQAIRTKSKGLLFVQLRKDASWMRPALGDWMLMFRKPGENEVPIHPNITNDEWISWARPIWYGIKESDTLNVQQARDDRDERHICPLQLGTLERCIRLWSNPGETIFDPFSGIGSAGVVALRHGREFVGTELKPQYARVAVRNLTQAEEQNRPVTLFDLVEQPA